jgi:pimeloyl-ACP methyl ester carboxylesterase
MFGSSKNWIIQGKSLTTAARVFALDLRNHGDSPHSDSHTLEDLIGDLETWLKENLDENPILLGHSMGGSAAMGYSLEHPRAVRGLIVVDIAPRSYRFRHDREMDALKIDLTPYRSRSEIEEAMAPLVPDLEVRRFLLMNAERSTAGFRWKIDPELLTRSTAVQEMDGLGGTFTGSVLFVFGDDSPYYSADDIPRIRGFFPAARIEVIRGAGHWLHYSHADEFRDTVERFIRSL